MTQMLNAGDLGLIDRFRRSPGGGHGNPLWYSCLENPHKQRSLVGYSPWGHKVLDKTEWLSPAHTDMKRCKDWNREISSWKQLNLFRRFPPDSLEHRVLESNLKSLRGGWTSTVSAPEGSFLTRADGKRPCCCSSVAGNVLGKCQFIVGNTHMCLLEMLGFGSGGFHHSSPGLIISSKSMLTSQRKFHPLSAFSKMFTRTLIVVIYVQLFSFKI